MASKTFIVTDKIVSDEEEFKKKLDEYRISKDIFDIGLLTRLAATGKVEFDEKYYEGIIVDIK